MEIFEKLKNGERNNLQDFHIHSNVSDCDQSMETLVKIALEKGMTDIAFSDHDTTSGYDEVIQLNKKYNINIIPSIEISAWDGRNGKKVHILGYDYKNKELLEDFCEDVRTKRNDNCIKQIKTLSSLGYNITEVDVRNYVRHEGGIYKQHIMDYLTFTGQADGIYKGFYRKIFKNNGPCHQDIEYVEAVDAVRAIVEAGGIAVLAHPLQQENLYLVPELVEAGLKGIELHHPSCKEERKEEILKLARQYDLYLTGGSDYHGKYDNIMDNVIGGKIR